MGTDLAPELLAQRGAGDGQRLGALARFVGHTWRRLAAHPAQAASASAIWAAYASYQLWVVVRTSIGYWQDPSSYASVARHPFPSLGLLAGWRPPLTPILWKLTGSLLSFAVVQTLIGIASWSLLALVTARLVRPGAGRLVAGGLVLAFASCWQVTEWNWNFLSESLAISLTVVLLSGALLCIEQRTRTGIGVMLVAAVLLMADRDQEVVSLGTAAIVAIVVAAGYAVVRRKDRLLLRKSLLGGLAALVLLAASGLGLAGEYSSSRNVVNVEDVFVVRVFPFPARVAWFAAHGMPEKSKIDQVAGRTTAPTGTAKVVYPNLQAPVFAPLAGWFARHSRSAYVEYLVTHPGYDVTAPFASPVLTYNDANGNLAFYGSLIGPRPSGTALPGLPVVLFPPWPVVALLGGAGAVAALLLWRRRREVAVLVLFALFGAWSMFVAWHGDGMEVARHMVEGTMAARLAALELVIVAVLGEQSSRTTRAGGPSVPEH